MYIIIHLPVIFAHPLAGNKAKACSGIAAASEAQQARQPLHLRHPVPESVIIGSKE
jgi:hypothetical protein